MPESIFENVIINIQKSKEVIFSNEKTSDFFGNGYMTREKFILIKSKKGYELRTCLGPFRTGMMKILFEANSFEYTLKPRIENTLIYILGGIILLTTPIVLILDNFGVIFGAIYYFFIYLIFLFIIIFIMLWLEYRDLIQFINLKAERH